jgi:tetratricopeptide (TPR) repeat protein
MASRPRSRALALVLTLLPGWGHVYWGRELLGTVIFTVAAAAFFGLVNGLFIVLGAGRTVLAQGSAALLTGVVGYAWADILRRTSPNRLQAEESHREKSLIEGMIAHLRGEHERAGQLFLSCLKADPTDVEALFRMGMTTARAGRREEAIRWLRRTRRNDLEGKWRWEVERELASLRRAPSRGPAVKAPAEKEKHAGATAA